MGLAVDIPRDSQYYAGTSGLGGFPLGPNVTNGSGHDPGLKAPILWNSTASPSQRAFAVVLLCGRSAEHVEKWRPRGGEY